MSSSRQTDWIAATASPHSKGRGGGGSGGGMKVTTIATSGPEIATARASRRATVSVLEWTTGGVWAMETSWSPQERIRQPFPLCWCIGHDALLATQHGAAAQARAPAQTTTSPKIGASSIATRAVNARTVIVWPAIRCALRRRY